MRAFEPRSKGASEQGREGESDPDRHRWYPITNLTTFTLVLYLSPSLPLCVLFNTDQEGAFFTEEEKKKGEKRLQNKWALSTLQKKKKKKKSTVSMR
jgi:hypothetical protein